MATKHWEGVTCTGDDLIMQTDKAKIDECETPQLLPFRVPVGPLYALHITTTFILSPQPWGTKSPM